MKWTVLSPLSPERARLITSATYVSITSSLDAKAICTIAKIADADLSKRAYDLSAHAMITHNDANVGKRAGAANRCQAESRCQTML